MIASIGAALIADQLHSLECPRILLGKLGKTDGLRPVVVQAWVMWLQDVKDIARLSAIPVGDFYVVLWAED